VRILDGVEAALRAGRSGETTAEVAARTQQEHQERGLHHLYALVCAGPHYFRAPSAKRIWEMGKPLHIDTGALLDGYVVEICRMGHLGQPSALADDLMNACRELRDHALKMFRAGVPVRELQAHANAFVAANPHGAQGKFIAHGIGMVHHEDPIVSLESGHILEAGMVLSIEMEYRHEEIGHIKVEELVTVTDDGSELITPRGERWTLVDR
jgi:Xaa-Pro aminopeptidase